MRVELAAKRALEFVRTFCRQRGTCVDCPIGEVYDCDYPPSAWSVVRLTDAVAMASYEMQHKGQQPSIRYKIVDDSDGYKFYPVDEREDR